MGTIIKFPSTGAPELRVQVLAKTLEHIASTPDRVTYGALFDAVRIGVNKPEEECSLEIMGAASLLVCSGLVTTNTFDGETFTIGAETILTASPRLTGWVWRDPAGGNEIEG